MGISPRHGSHAALPIACDALNARTVAVRKYHCIFCVSSPASRYTCFPARCWSLGCPGGDNLTRIASWRTRRMARRKRNVSDLPYAAPPLSCGLSLSRSRVKVRLNTQSGKGDALYFPLICLEVKDSPHDLCLQPLPQVLIYAPIGIAAFVADFLHRQVGYVALVMLQDKFHSVGVALRCG